MSPGNGKRGGSNQGPKFVKGADALDLFNRHLRKTYTFYGEGGVGLLIPLLWYITLGALIMFMFAGWHFLYKHPSIYWILCVFSGWAFMVKIFIIRWEVGVRLFQAKTEIQSREGGFTPQEIETIADGLRDALWVTSRPPKVQIPRVGDVF